MKNTEKKDHTESFDFTSFEEEAIKKLMAGENLAGENGVLTPLIQRFLQKAMETEMKLHIEDSKAEGNRRNGHGQKQVKTDLGEVSITPPRDRQGSFAPEILPKRQTTLTGTLDKQILSMYAKGMSYEAIRGHMRDIYGLQISEAKLTAITDQIWENVLAWQNRPLDEIYVIVWLDAIHYKVKEAGQVVTKAVYNIMGVNQSGYKEVLGMYVGEHEGARFWLEVLENLRSRGIRDILIACIDHLKGFAEAIQTVFPATDVQACVVHQVRNSLNCVPYKDSKELLRDMKSIYQSINLEQAEAALVTLAEKWGKKYPKIVSSWQTNWPRLSTFLEYPPAVRRLVYTTNPIESLHSQLRKITKSKRSFTSDQALLKLLYLVQKEVTTKWANKPVFRWKTIKAQLLLMFPDRINLDTLY
jgi:putative transposase